LSESAVKAVAFQYEPDVTVELLLETFRSTIQRKTPKLGYDN